MYESLEVMISYFQSHMTLVALIFFILFEQFYKRFNSFKISSKDQGENFIWITLTEFIFESLISAGKFFFVVKLNSIFKHFGVFQFDISHTHFIFQAISYLLLYSFVLFLLHMCFHKIPFLWNFHKLHHSTNELTSSATLRGHPIETIILDGVGLGIVNLLMFDQSLLEYVNLFILFWTFFLHSNTRIKLNLLRWILITPHDHLWHHAKDCKIKSGQNYGGILSIWDRLFKTYYYHEDTPSSGIHENYTKNYLKKLINPFLYK